MHFNFFKYIFKYSFPSFSLFCMILQCKCVAVLRIISLCLGKASVMNVLTSDIFSCIFLRLPGTLH